MKNWKLLLAALPCLVGSAFAAAPPSIYVEQTLPASERLAGEDTGVARALPWQVSQARIAQTGQGVRNPQEVPERWGFFFDASGWQLGYQAADSLQSVREYVVQGETVHNWSKLVTSHYLKLDVTPQAYFQKMTQAAARGCPSLKISMIEETEDTIIFEWENDGCNDHPPQREIRRISRARPGILNLSFAEKRPFSNENRDVWLSILKSAVALEPAPRGQGAESAAATRSLPASALGSLPSNESSEYIETLGTGILVDMQERTGRLTIELKPKPRLPVGAYLEAHFENPANSASPIVVGQTWQGRDDKAFFGSPALKQIKCWNYEVVVYVYQDSSKRTLLGTHHQRIQSRVNLEKADFDTHPQSATTGASCP